MKLYGEVKSKKYHCIRAFTMHLDSILINRKELKHYAKIFHKR